MHIEIQVHHEDSAFLKTERARDKFTSLFISRMGELVPSANVNLFLTSIMVEPEGDGWHRANKMWVRSDSEDIRESMHVRDMAKRAWMYASNAPGLSR